MYDVAIQYVRQKFSTLHAGDSLKDIFYYLLPELISVMILIVGPPIIDSYIVANSQTALSYGALAMSANLIHTLTKFAEAIPVAAIAVIGRHNGAGRYDVCGKDFSTTFWLIVALGLAQLGLIFFGAPAIYTWLGVPPEMMQVGVPFLRLKSLGVFLIFILLGFFGFLRAVKNTKVPMFINIIGILTFVFFDYALVQGKFGFPNFELYGSALATIIQYAVMNSLAFGYIWSNVAYKKYFSETFLSFFSFARAAQLIYLGLPIVLDKTSFAFSYVWLSKMIAGLGTYAITTFDVIKHVERFSFLPAIACAQVVTFLVSNRLGARDAQGAAATVKKCLFVALIGVCSMLFLLCLNATRVIGWFDPTNQFSHFGARVLPFVSVLVIFDIVQVILAGALRGAGDVRAVMWGRILVVGGFFVPLSWLAGSLPIASKTLKFVLIYGMYYLSTGVLSCLFLYRMHGQQWQKTEIDIFPNHKN